MSTVFCDETLILIKQLVSNLTEFEEPSDIFSHVFKYAVGHLQAADSMFYNTQREIDDRVNDLAEKFAFHGFQKQAEDFKAIYESYMDQTLHKDEIKNRLNVMRLLFELSVRPTQNLVGLLTESRTHLKPPEEPFDWGNYLLEGVERWNPPLDSDSDEWSEDESTTENPYLAETDSVNSYNEIFKDQIHMSKPDDLASKIELATVENSVQHTWFNSKDVRMLPASSHWEANVAIRWENFLTDCTHGLIPINHAKILSEHQIVREVLWQLWGPHESVAFRFDKDKLVPRENVTIASTRAFALQEFLEEFVPYIETLQYFKDFETQVVDFERPSAFPGTYSAYVASVQGVLRPIMKGIVDLEMTAMKQEQTLTLLILADALKDLFGPVSTLHKAHAMGIKGQQDATCLQQTTHLLRTLRDGLFYAITKQEQDVYLCLYLESLYTYMHIIDNWFDNRKLRDERAEFPIVGDAEWRVAEELSADALEDGLLRLICTQVLQTGKNISMLLQLGKQRIIHKSESAPLHRELVERVLAEIADYFGDEICPVGDAVEAAAAYKFPAICNDFCKIPTDMDKLENLVDMSDGFLMSAVEEFFVEDCKDDDTCEVSLYERICQTTRDLFPAQQVVENALAAILKTRYGDSGLLLKSTLTHDHDLWQHFQLLQHVFLFKDDIIFPFYRRIFEKADSMNMYWGNGVWLTSHLRDVLMDTHPDFSTQVTVYVEEAWRGAVDDPLKACSLLKINYLIEWPINIIISQEQLQMYQELFSFILQIKWAIFTLNHLQFIDIEPKKRSRGELKSRRLLQCRLQVLRFGLINTFASIQHHVLGYASNKCALQLAADFEEACDLEELIKSHATFIEDLHAMAVRLRDFNEESYGFYLLLYIVRKLRNMWNDPKSVNERDLGTCEYKYKECHVRLYEVICPDEFV